MAFVDSFFSNCKNARRAVDCGLIAFALSMLGYLAKDDNLAVLALPTVAFMVPLFFSFLSYGREDGLLSFVVSLILGVIAIFAVDGVEDTFFINIAGYFLIAIVGVYSVSKVEENGKTSWYPESSLFSHTMLWGAAIMLAFCCAHYDILLQALEPKMVNAKFGSIYSGVSVGCVSLLFAVWLFVSLLIAQKISEKHGMNLRPHLNFYNVKVRGSVSLIALVCFCAACLCSTKDTQVVSVMLTALSTFIAGAILFSGLSLVHSYARALDMNWKIFSFAIFYAMLVSFPILLLVPLSLGFVDSFYPLRARADD